MTDSSYNVRIWSAEKRPGSRGTRHRLRWQVAGHRFSETFATAKLADSFRAELMVSVRAGAAFDISTGRPVSTGTSSEHVTWFDFAVAYSQFKWPQASPRHRKGIAEALVALTVALVRDEARHRDARSLRLALSTWAFNEAGRGTDVPAEFAPAISWIRRASLPIAALAEPSRIRQANESLSRRLDGQPAAPATVVRKRATLNNALEYAVELGHLSVNPLRQVRVPVPRSDDAVDRRVVVNPTQAAALLAAVAERDPALEGFFASIYYAGLRPAEARGLRLGDCHLPGHGWGRVVLTGSQQHSGRAWTDSGLSEEERSLKHRSSRSTRPVPLHPTLVGVLRAHLDRFDVGTDGHLFVTRTGKAGVPISPPYDRPASLKVIYRAWQQARVVALGPEQVASPLARRPYDLRHACLSTWLNAGVPPAQVAAWAGHSIDVLLRVYAKCLDGEEQGFLDRIDAALPHPEKTHGGRNSGTTRAQTPVEDRS